MIFFHALGGTIGLAVGQNIFMSSLHRDLSINVPDIKPQIIIDKGPMGFRDFILPGQLPGVLESYNDSLAKAFITPIAAAAAALLSSLLLEWHSVKGTGSQEA
jgi:hypothetical protein